MLNMTTASEQKIYSTGRSYCMKVYSMDTVAYIILQFSTQTTHLNNYSIQTVHIIMNYNLLLTCRLRAKLRFHPTQRTQLALLCLRFGFCVACACCVRYLLASLACNCSQGHRVALDGNKTLSM